MSKNKPAHRTIHCPLSDGRIELWHLTSFPLATGGGFRRGRPLGTKFFRAADDAFDENGGRLFLRGSVGSSADGQNSNQLEFVENRFQGAIRTAEIFCAANPRDNPTH